MIRVIALTGQMGSGKSTAADIIKQKIVHQTAVIKFAQPLYDMQESIYKIINRPVPHPKDRKLLQWLGTDWGRTIDENIWTSVWKERAEFFLASNQDSVVLVDDCRYDNEAEIIKELGGVVINIEASKQIRAERIPLIETGHPSERGIDKRFLHTTLVNEGDVLDLGANINNLLCDLGLVYRHENQRKVIK